jgi:putative NIF3 family GTP cyclohydrolase 1 type 2
MKAIELNLHLNGLVQPLPESTVDRVVYGDPQTEVRGIAVAWMPFADVVERAAASGANLLVVHEPTFYDHWDLQGSMAGCPETAAKKALLDNLGMTVIRCHDVWDAMPGIGIPFAWADFLGLDRCAKRERYYQVYEIDPRPALEVARYVAGRTAALGQAQVGFYGDPDRPVRLVGIGTGCYSDPFEGYRLGADLAVAVDDIMTSWIAGERCRDTGSPVVVVNHGVSEEPGMASLARYLAGAFPDVPVAHIPVGCSYRAVVAR